MAIVSCQHADGGFLIYGTYNDVSMEDSEMFLLKINGQGGVEWIKDYDFLNSMGEDGDAIAALPRWRIYVIG